MKLSWTTSSASCSLPVIRNARRKTLRLCCSTRTRNASSSPCRALASTPALSAACAINTQLRRDLGAAVRWAYSRVPRGGDAMNTIEQLVDGFVGGRVTRRELIAAVAALAGAAAHAQSAAVARGRTLNHVSLAVTDVERSAAFYSKILDLHVVSRPGNGGI